MIRLNVVVVVVGVSVAMTISFHSLDQRPRCRGPACSTRVRAGRGECIFYAYCTQYGAVNGITHVIVLAFKKTTSGQSGGSMDTVPGAESVYQVGKLFRERCFDNRRSFLWPDNAIWTENNLET